MITWFWIDRKMLDHNQRDVSTTTFQITMSMILCLLVIFLIAFCLQNIQYNIFDKIEIDKLRDTLLPMYRMVLKPEPQERLAFLIGVFLAIPLGVAALFYTMKQSLTHRLDNLYSVLIGFFSLLVFTIIISNHVIQIPLNNKHNLNFYDVKQFPIIMVYFVILLIITKFNIKYIDNVIRTSLTKKAISIIVLTLVSIFIAMNTIALNVRQAYMLEADIHFEAIFYSVSQVMNGKHVLVHFASQYGLFAELLKPLLTLFINPVISFSILMCVMQLVASFLLFSIVNSSLKSFSIKSFAFIALAWFMGSNFYFEEYYQVFPIRFFFPVLGLFLFYMLWKYEQDLFRSLIISLVVATGLIWNLESGIALFGAYMITISMRFFFPLLTLKKFNRREFYNVCISLISIIFYVLLVICIIYRDSIVDANFSDLIKYHKIFYMMGFGMLRMPTYPHLWMIVICIYFTCIIVGMRGHIVGKVTRYTELQLFLGILGVGLFAYYQGRSHDVVLSFVIWPAIVAGFIFSDKIFRAVRSNKINKVYLWLPVSAISFSLLVLISLVASIPQTWKISQERIAGALNPKISPRIQQNLDFIKKATGEKISAVILTKGQSIYYAMANLSSSISGQGLAETILLEDFKKKMSEIYSKDVGDLFIAKQELTYFPIDYNRIEKKYELVRTNQNGLSHFVWKIRRNPIKVGVAYSNKSE